MRLASFAPLALLALLGACGTEPSGTVDPDAPAQPPDGAALFAENCSKCHGTDGKGTQDGPQILSPVAGYATYVVRHGRNDMGFPAPMALFTPAVLPDSDLSLILGYLDAAPHPTDAAGLYTRYCVNCHGANGRAGRVKINIVAHVAELSLKVRSGHGGTNYAARTSYMPAWPATEITDADLAALRSYVSAL
jgi:mono/diheme cytochrome c family protein